MRNPKMLLSIAAIWIQFCMLTSIATEPNLPPKNLKEEWVTLEREGFYNWRNIKHHRSGGVADGGSVSHGFRLQDGSEFSVLVANPTYWAATDKAKKIQVIYVVRGGRFYLLKPGSEQEKHLLGIIRKGKIDPAEDAEATKKLLTDLCETIKTRKSKWLYP